MREEINIQNETKELIHIVKNILHGNSDDRSGKAINYSNILKIAKKNSIANTVADVINERENVPEDIKENFLKKKEVVVSKQRLTDYHLQELFSSLDRHRIRGLFFKGTLLRCLYPEAYMRSMGDVDVYADQKDMEAVFELMTASDCETDRMGSGNHYVYTKSRYIKIEFHPELVSMKSEYGKIFKGIHPEAESIPSYIDIWAHTLPIDDNEYARQFTPEYHYLYIIMHMANHFLGGGTGIRSVMDVWVMNQHYHEEWNREKIEELLADYGLLTFERFALALADKWFEFEAVDYIPDVLTEGSGIDVAELEQFEEYILNSGTYGDLNQSLAREMDYGTGKVSQIRFLFSRFFLPYKTMKNIYPVLEKAPVLLPVYWPYRVIEMFSKRGKAAKGKMKAVRTLDSDKAERQKALYEMVMRE